MVKSSHVGFRVFVKGNINDLGTVTADEGGKTVVVKLDDGGSVDASRLSLVIWSYS